MCWCGIFVRYVCGVPECNYLTVEEAMLRHHLKALHSDEVYFRCPHCPPPTGTDPVQNIALEKMGIHLKMHDSRLYKCSHCIYHHYHRFVNFQAAPHRPQSFSMISKIFLFLFSFYCSRDCASTVTLCYLRSK